MKLSMLNPFVRLAEEKQIEREANAWCDRLDGGSVAVEAMHAFWEWKRVPANALAYERASARRSRASGRQRFATNAP